MVKRRGGLVRPSVRKQGIDVSHVVTAQRGNKRKSKMLSEIVETNCEETELPVRVPEEIQEDVIAETEDEVPIEAEEEVIKDAKEGDIHKEAYDHEEEEEDVHEEVEEVHDEEEPSQPKVGSGATAETSQSIPTPEQVETQPSVSKNKIKRGLTKYGLFRFCLSTLLLYDQTRLGYVNKLSYLHI